MDKKLDFLVIGAQKCATSWMYYCLKEHSEILLPNDKLEYAYFGSDLFKEKGQDWYYERYNEIEEGQIRGEVAVDYIYDTSAAQFLKDNEQNPKLIASLRHPVDRFVSSYYWLIRKNKLPNVSINDGIEIVLDQPEGFPNTIDSPLEEVVRRGCYAHQLDAYLKHYNPERFFILLYEEVDKTPLETLKRIFDFLEVDSSFVPKSLNVQPKKNSYNSNLIKLERLVDRKYLLGKILSKIANKANQVLSKNNKPSTGHQLKKSHRDKLISLYKPEMERTIEIMSKLPVNNRPSQDALTNLWKVKGYEG